MFNSVNIVSIFLTKLQNLKRDPYASVEHERQAQPMVISQRFPRRQAHFLPPHLVVRL